MYHLAPKVFTLALEVGLLLLLQLAEDLHSLIIVGVNPGAGYNMALLAGLLMVKRILQRNTMIIYAEYIFIP